MAQTIANIKLIKKQEKFIREFGDDELITSSISKMMDYKLMKYEEQIKKLDKELKQFERSYKMESSSFIKEFTSGRQGDEMDFVEWASLYRMRQRLAERKAKLEGMR